MNREIEVIYSKQIIKFAVWKFWTRSIGVWGFISFGLVVLAFLYFLISGDRSWLIGVLGSFVGLCILSMAALYFIPLSRSMERFRQMEKPTANLHFNDDRIGITSDIGFTELSWKMIEKIWKYPPVWLVFIAKQGYITLPTANLDDELKRFITSKVTEQNKEVES